MCMCVYVYIYPFRAIGLNLVTIYFRTWLSDQGTLLPLLSAMNRGKILMLLPKRLDIFFCSFPIFSSLFFSLLCVNHYAFENQDMHLVVVQSLMIRDSCQRTSPFYCFTMMVEQVNGTNLSGLSGLSMFLCGSKPNGKLCHETLWFRAFKDIWCRAMEVSCFLWCKVVCQTFSASWHYCTLWLHIYLGWGLRSGELWLWGVSSAKSKSCCELNICLWDAKLNISNRMQVYKIGKEAWSRYFAAWFSTK